jgi:hypothetical protein
MGSDIKPKITAEISSSKILKNLIEPLSSLAIVTLLLVFFYK